MRILIANRFMPPDDAPTSVLAGELAEHLQASGHDVELISSSTNYRCGGKGGIRRITDELLSHAILFVKMVTARNIDLVVCLSSPTCLPVTVAAAAMIRRIRFAHWAMDVYPEVAVRLDEIRQGGIVHRITSGLMNWAYGRADTLVALDEDMQDLFAEKGHRSHVCSPWTPLALHWPAQDTIASTSQQPVRWVYSGNLGRAHEWEALLLAQQLLEKSCPGKFELIFQGGGANRKPAQQRSRELGLQHCLWKDYAPKEALLDSLFEADVLVATQNPETKGLLWPSKLAVMKRVPRPILWVGPEGSAVSHNLSARTQTATIPVSQNTHIQIADWLRQLHDSPESSRNQLPFAPPDENALRQPIAELEDILIN